MTDWIDLAPDPPTPPPASKEPSPEPTNGFRWPFKAALLLVVVVTVAIGAAETLAPTVVLFGWALLNRAHRQKIW